nr:DUF3397 family protein [uncultured Trichococcus sp.]
MQNFHYSEILLYVFPILEIILINKFFRPYLRYKQMIQLTVADVVLPFLLVGIHLLSVYSLTYSLLPHFLLAACFIGMLQTLYFDLRKKNHRPKQFYRYFIKILFLMALLFYYMLVFLRIYFLVRG